MSKALRKQLGSIFAVSFLLVWVCLAAILFFFFGESVAQSFLLIGAVAVVPALILATISQSVARFCGKESSVSIFLSIFAVLSFCIDLCLNIFYSWSNLEMEALSSALLLVFPLAAVLFFLFCEPHEIPNNAKQD